MFGTVDRTTAILPKGIYDSGAYHINFSTQSLSAGVYLSRFSQLTGSEWDTWIILQQFIFSLAK